MQPRDKLILEFWDRSGELHANNIAYRNFINEFLSLLLESDTQKGDLTSSSLIEKNKNISARVIAKENGILAGIEELRLFNRDLKIKQFKNDGSAIKKGDAILELGGNAIKILQRERTNLNLLQRMSGIAAITNNLSKKSGSVKIAATRKTLWGLLDKKAVSVGRGLTHRLNLNDGMIIKDNHLKLIGYDFEKAINSIKTKSGCIEVEVENESHALKAAIAIKKAFKKNNKSLYAIMLDKMPPKSIKSIIKNIKNQDLYNYALLEASGNINGDNLRRYSDCGVDVVSMGCITNSAKALDMCMEIK